MSSWFSDAWDATQQEDDEQNTGDVPYAAPVRQPAVSGPINPNQGGFRDPVYNPANITPGDQYAPNPDMGIFTPFHPVNEALFGQQGIATPYLEPARDFLGEFGGALGSAIESPFRPYLPGTPGGGFTAPEPGPISQAGTMLGEGLIGNSVEEIGANFIGAKGPLEGITGLPLDDLLRGGRGVAADVVRAGMPEPSLYPGLSGGIPPMNPLGGENVFGPGVHGGGLPVPPPTTDLEGALRASLEARGVTPPPIEPAFPERYPSFPEGTMGEMFPDVVREQGIDPRSPAARMGAPLAYDPQFMPPPEGVNVGGLPNEFDDTMRQMREASANVRGPEGGGSLPETSSSVTPPPPSPLPPGQQRIEDAIANNPNLTESQKEFLRSPNGQASAAQLDGALTGANPPPNAITPETARATAREMGAPESLADKIERDWGQNQQALYGTYASPEGMARATAFAENLARPVEGAVTGVNSDSFLNAVLTERTNLERMLQRAGVPADEVAQRVENAVSGMVAKHYPNNPEKAAALHGAIAQTEARAKELANDFRVMRGINDVWKNTVAGVGDIAYFGQNLLSSAFQAGPQILIGSANRIAAALHFPLALDWEKVTGLPNLIAKESAGINFKAGEGMLANAKGNTILGIAPKYNPLAGLDKHVVMPIVNASNKLQFDMVGGWIKNSMADGALLQQYVFSFAQGMKRFGGDIAAAKNYALEQVARPDVQRDIGRFVSNATSSTNRALTPGRNLAEELSIFSAPYTRAQFGRMADMTKLITPGASEAQRVLAASSILSAAAFTLGLYKFLNDKFGTTDAELDPTQIGPKDGRPGFGRIVLPGGQVVSLVPQASMRNAVIKSTEALAKGNPEDIKAIMFQAGTGREGLWPQLATRAFGYGYDTQGNFYSPFTNDGKKMPTEERLKASAPLPFAAQPIVFNGQPVLSGNTALNVSGLNTYQESKPSEAFRERGEARQIESRALVNGDLLRAAFPDNPDIAAALQGREWQDIGFYEKQAILKSLPPEQAKQIEEADAASSAANKEKPTAVGNAIEIRNREKAAEDKVMTEAQGTFKTLESALTDGQHDPYKVRLAITEAEKQLRQDLTVERWKGGTTYTGLPWKDREGLEHIPGSLQTALNNWYNIGDNLPRDTKGNINFDALNAMKAAFLQELRKDDPETFARLSFHIQQQEAEADAKKPDILKFYDQVQATSLRGYYANPEGTRSQWARENPVDNAKLWVAGYIPYLFTPMAVAIASELAPDRKPVMAR